MLDWSQRRVNTQRDLASDLRKQAVFLDRDGTIAVDVPYCRRIEDFCFWPEAMEALATLGKTDFLIVVITNQSGIGRGFFDHDTLSVLHSHMVEQVTNHGGRIDAIYYCPHHPDDGCACRKPHPGLLMNANQDMGIDLTRSYFIGDQESDVLAAHAAGCKAVILNRSGATSTESKAEKSAADLVEAVTWVVDEAIRPLSE